MCSSDTRPDWFAEVLPSGRFDRGLVFDQMVRVQSSTDSIEPLATLLREFGDLSGRISLWFHHVPWEYVMRNGFDSYGIICYIYNSGSKMLGSLWFVAESSTVYRHGALRSHVDAIRTARRGCGMVAGCLPALFPNVFSSSDTGRLSAPNT